MDAEVPSDSNSIQKVDRYGFFESSFQRKPVYDEKLENQRLKKWLVMLKNWKTFCEEKPNVVKRRIRKGIPDALRGRVWSILLSADVCSDIYNGYYDNLQANHVADEGSDYTRNGGVIDRDINRTYPAHEDYVEKNGLGQETLRHVLYAFADHDKEIKYTQGMNYIVGLFLNYMTEEESFFALRQLMENTPYRMNKWFNQSLTMVHTSHYQMEKLLQKYLPQLATHLTDLSIMPSMYTTEWFMCVFSRSFPYDVVVRVWDIFLAEGWTIVYQVSLALLKLYQNDLLKLEFEDAYTLISGIYKDENLPSADVIINTALSFPITVEELETYRKEFARKQMVKSSFVYFVCYKIINLSYLQF